MTAPIPVRIVAAAVLIEAPPPAGGPSGGGNGPVPSLLVVSAPPPFRHHHLVQDLSRLNLRAKDQGFLVSDGRFADREWAWKVAVAAGQLLPRAPTDGKRVWTLAELADGHAPDAGGFGSVIGDLARDLLAALERVARRVLGTSGADIDAHEGGERP